MATGPTSQTSVLPVFIHSRSLPGEQYKQYTVSEICGACEKKTGYNSILGAQRLGAWRIYPASLQARNTLLCTGITLRGLSVTLYDKNPLIVSSNPGGGEVKTTKLIIGNVPLSFANSEIEAGIEKLGAKPRSALYMERDRDSSGALTHWLTGRRFIYIEIPKDPLPRRFELGPFKPTLFHYEQKLAQTTQQQTCGKCLQSGHSSSMCPNDITCLDCQKSGHKRGSPDCDVIDRPTPTRQTQHTGMQPPATPADASGPSQKGKEGESRSRPVTRSKRSPRARSYTPNPKRRSESTSSRGESPARLTLDWWTSLTRKGNPPNDSGDQHPASTPSDPDPELQQRRDEGDDTCG